MCSYLRLEYVETSRHFGDQMRVTVFANAKGEKEREKEKGETAEKVNKQSQAREGGRATRLLGEKEVAKETPQSLRTLVLKIQL